MKKIFNHGSWSLAPLHSYACMFNSIALRRAITLLNFGPTECNSVEERLYANVISTLFSLNCSFVNL